MDKALWDIHLIGYNLIDVIICTYNYSAKQMDV